MGAALKNSFQAHLHTVVNDEQKSEDATPKGEEPSAADQESTENDEHKGNVKFLDAEVISLWAEPHLSFTWSSVQALSAAKGLGKAEAQEFRTRLAMKVTWLPFYSAAALVATADSSLTSSSAGA